MPSPRSSPAMRPSSPLSTGYKAPAFDTLQPLSPRANHSRPAVNSNNSWRAHRGSLKLPGFPKYHPANYASSYSSLQNTPDGQSSSPQPPTSPRAFQKLYSDAQKQLFSHQRGMVSAAKGSGSLAGSGQINPGSPRLAPLGSPGPVTPLSLERDEGYLLAGARNAGHDASQPELVDRLIREEARRRQQQADQGLQQSHER